MWVVVYIAHNKKLADSILDLLSKEGVMHKLKPVYKNVAPENNCYEILVPQSEAREAHKILMDNGY
mgnify:CR=1 FL=1